MAGEVCRESKRTGIQICGTSASTERERTDLVGSAFLLLYGLLVDGHRFSVGGGGRRAVVTFDGVVGLFLRVMLWRLVV